MDESPLGGFSSKCLQKLSSCECPRLSRSRALVGVPLTGVGSLLLLAGRAGALVSRWGSTGVEEEVWLGPRLLLPSLGQIASRSPLGVHQPLWLVLYASYPVFSLAAAAAVLAGSKNMCADGCLYVQPLSVHALNIAYRDTPPSGPASPQRSAEAAPALPSGQLPGCSGILPSPLSTPSGLPREPW